MRTVLVGLLLLTAACHRPSRQFSSMLTPVNQPDDYTRNLKAGDEVVAVGTDPAWTLLINPSKKTLRFKSQTGDSLTTTAPDRQDDSDGIFRYKAEINGNSLTLLFRPDSCVDKLSEQRYDYRVEADYKGKSYVGCGVSLRQLTLLQDDWVLTELQGQPVAAGARGELPRLEISLTEGRVTGTTGCNRLNGPVKADTRQIQFGSLSTTRIACLGELGQLESKFLSELSKPLAYRVGDNKLTLLRDDKPIMTFKKVD